MDTPDKAAGLADLHLADAINRDWLLASGRSSQLSTFGGRRRRFDESSESFSGPYGSAAPLSSQIRPLTTNNESSWLLSNYERNKTRKQEYRANEPRFDASINSASSNHLYDNISFAGEKEAPTWASSKAALANTSEDNWPPTTGLCFGRFRIFLACYLLLGITLATYSRNALSLAAVGMVANNELNRQLVAMLAQSSNLSSPLDTVEGAALDGSCPLPTAIKQHSTSLSVVLQASSSSQTALRDSIRERVERGELVDWSPSEQGLIFAAGSVGNLLMAVPLTRMGEIYGPKWIVFTAVLGATIQAALMPLVASQHVVLVILFQVIFNGLTFGADCVAYTLFAHWLTQTEMAFFVSCLLICYQLGTIISSFMTARILSQGSAWGWCFYTPALLCAVWTVVWTIVGASQPSKSLLISKSELGYLLRWSKIAQSNPSNGDHPQRQQQPGGRMDNAHQVCWRKLASDRNIWAIVAVKFTLRWYFSVYISMMPTYLSSVAHMSVGLIGQMSMFQSLVGLFSGILMGYLTKSVVLRRPFNLSLAAFRKLFQSIVNFGLALSLVVFIAFDCNQWVTICALTISGICINFYVAAALQLPLDLSPDHCGLITSITNTLALGQILGAPVSGLILNSGPKNRTLWRIVWSIAILLNTLSGLVFLFLVDSKTKDYNKHYPSENGGRSCSSVTHGPKLRKRDEVEDRGCTCGRQ